MNFNMLQQNKVVKEILQVRGKLTIWNLKKHYLARKNLGCQTNDFGINMIFGCQHNSTNMGKLIPCM